MEILITGSSGFIGSALKRKLETKGVKVTSYDIKDAPPNDVRDFSTLKVKMQGVDGVIHLGAISRIELAQRDPLNCVYTNIGGTANVLEAARFYKREDARPWVIFCSSKEVFGRINILPATEKTPKKPINIYGVSNMASEQLCKVFSRSYGIKTRILRISDVYTGKNDHLDRVVPKFIIQSLRGEDLVINGSGGEIFDFIYISDVINGILSCIRDIQTRGVLYDDFILSTGRPVSLSELVEMIIEKTESESQVKYEKTEPYRAKKFYGDPQKARDILGFDPSIMLEEGISLAVREFKREKLI